MFYGRIAIFPYSDLSKCWEAFPNDSNSEIKLNTYKEGNQDQIWVWSNFRLKINTKNKGAKVAESYPGDNRLETSSINDKNSDQYFEIELASRSGGEAYHIYCDTINEGRMYVYSNCKTGGIGLKSYKELDYSILWIIDQLEPVE